MSGTLTYDLTTKKLNLHITGLPPTTITDLNTNSNSIIINFASVGIDFIQNSPSQFLFFQDPTETNNVNFQFNESVTLTNPLIGATLAGQIKNVINIIFNGNCITSGNVTGFSLTMCENILSFVPSSGTFINPMKNIAFGTITFEDLFGVSIDNITLTTL